MNTCQVQLRYYTGICHVIGLNFLLDNTTRYTGLGKSLLSTTVNTLNKQTRRDYKGWYSSLGFKWGTNNPSLQEARCYEILLRASELAGFCEHGNEHSVSIKGGEFRDLLIDYQLLKKDSAPWS
jgi:hypothetical protein